MIGFLTLLTLRPNIFSIFLMFLAYNTVKRGNFYGDGDFHNHYGRTVS